MGGGTTGPKVLTLEKPEPEVASRTYICEECGEPVTGFRSYGRGDVGWLCKDGSDGLHPKCCDWRVLQHHFWKYIGKNGLLTEEQWAFLKGNGEL